MLLAAQDPMPDDRCADIRQREALAMTKTTDPLETVGKGSCSTGEAAKHEPAHGRIDDGLLGLWQPLIVLGQAARLAEPRERSLNDPSAR